MRNCTYKWPQSGHFFSKLGHFFPIFEKGQGRSPPSPLELRACYVYARATFAKRNLSTTFKTASILFASAVMILKHLLTTYFTVLPIQTKELPYKTKSEVLILAFWKWVMVLWQIFSCSEITPLVLLLTPSF